MEIVKYSIKKHPYFSAFYLWLYLFCTFGWFTVERVHPLNIVSSVVLIGVLIPMNELFLRKRNIRHEKKAALKKYLPVAALALYSALTLITYCFVPKNKLGWGRNAAVIIISGFIFFAAMFLYYRKKKITSFDKVYILVILAGFFFHFFFNVYSEFEIQVDLHFYSTDAFPEGHLGYMKYLYNNFIPVQTDPRQYWQFYHPPLHHYLEAFLLRAETALGTDIEVAVYNIKYLPLLYFMLMTITLRKLAQILNIKGKPLIFAMAIIVFSPGLLFISNYANNDMLSVFLMIESIYLAVLWYKDRRAGKILLTAGCFGAAMFAKLSSWMAAVPIAVIFIAALIEKLREKEYKTFGRYVGQMFAFLGIAVPLTLYWSLRNYLRFGVPIGYIPESRSNFQSISEPVWKRLVDFSPFQLAIPYQSHLRRGGTYVEYNPLISLLKTSSADIYIEKNLGSPFDMLNLITLWITCLLAFAAFIFMIRILVKKGTMPVTAKVAMLLFYGVVLVSYYIFCIKYPMTCTEDIRYASQLIMIGAFSVGIMLTGLSGKTGKKPAALRKFTEYLSIAFCVMSVLSFTTYGLWTTLYYNLKF